MAKQNKRVSRLLYLVWALGIILLAYLPGKTDFLILVLTYSVVFACYWFIINPKNRIRLKSLLFVAVLTRILIIPAVPALSDDVFRFVWDGQLVLSLENPYERTPSAWMEEDEDFPRFVDPELYHHLNSAEYYSIYPPLTQLVFGIGTAIARADSGGAAFWTKTFLVGIDILVLFIIVPLLRRIGRYPGMVAIYAFNPLVLLEISGNLHHEGLIIFFLALSLMYFYGQKGIRSGMMLGLAAGIKLVPLILIPVVMFVRGFRQRISFGIAAAVIAFISFLPLLFSRAYVGFLDSLNLYFQTFEFNASIYYVLRYFGYLFKGYNWIEVIGPLCSLLFLIFYIYFLVRWRKMGLDKDRLIDMMVIVLSLFFLFQTTVHPWYILPIVFLASLSGWKFPIIWSGLIIISYHTYATYPYQEFIPLSLLTYAVLFFSAYYFDRKRFARMFVMRK